MVSIKIVYLLYSEIHKTVEGCWLKTKVIDLNSSKNMKHINCVVYTDKFDKIRGFSSYWYNNLPDNNIKNNIDLISSSCTTVFCFLL